MLDIINIAVFINNTTCMDYKTSSRCPSHRVHSLVRHVWRDSGSCRHRPFRCTSHHSDTMYSYILRPGSRQCKHFSKGDRTPRPRCALKISVSKVVVRRQTDARDQLFTPFDARRKRYVRWRQTDAGDYVCFCVFNWAPPFRGLDPPMCMSFESVY